MSIFFPCACGCRYTESLYALLSLGGLYSLISGASNVAVLWFALSGCARSNGVLNAGYLCFQTLHQAYDAVFLKKRACVSIFYSFQACSFWCRCFCLFIKKCACCLFPHFSIRLTIWLSYFCLFKWKVLID